MIWENTTTPGRNTNYEENDVNTMAEMFFVTPNIDSAWTIGSAYQLRVSQYIIYLDRSMPWTIVLNFNEDLDATIRVRISEEEITEHHFIRRTNYKSIGVNGLYTIYYRVPRTRENETTELYIGIMPRVTIFNLGKSCSY